LPQPLNSSNTPAVSFNRSVNYINLVKKKKNEDSFTVFVMT